MSIFKTQGISLHYEVFGDGSKTPLLLLAGLGGAGRSWGSQIERLARNHFVILPDHRGTGQTTRANDGYTIDQLATDMASLVRYLDVGPVHVAGTSTGGAIGQAMALSHPDVVRSLIMASSFARADSYLKREFALRRKLMAESDMETVYSCYALFLFSPQYASDHPEQIESWITRAAGGEPEREISLKRIDMIVAHDVLSKLSSIRKPSLVMCGDQDFCTPLHLSAEIAQGIPNAEYVVFAGGGHFIHVEQEEKFFSTLQNFLNRH